MKHSELYQLVEMAFSSSALDEAIVEALEDMIDYEGIAAELVCDLEGRIQDVALAVARERLQSLPF